MKRDDLDFHFVRDQHIPVHERLVSWARWVRVRPQGWQMQPMFRQYRSKAWQWEAPVLHTPVNVPEALEIERVVSLLPEKNRTAVRWCYCFPIHPRSMARGLGVSMEGLMELVNDARNMVRNGIRPTNGACSRD